jgi:hypothetical protein
MTVRIVFDSGMHPSDYRAAVDQIHGIAYIMAEPVDSSSMSEYTVEQYQSRFTEYLNAFGDKVDIWEVGNEINGEWLCSSTANCNNATTATVVAKMTGAYDIIKGAGKKTALTLHFNEGSGCPTTSLSEMYSWVNTYVPDRMKQGLDYVLLSYYREGCPDVGTNAASWNSNFTKLGNIFPNSKLGFGEISTESVSASQSTKEDLIKEFYPMNITHPRYTKGIFWWFYKEEMVPYTNPLWNVLNNTLSKI